VTLGLSLRSRAIVLLVIVVVAVTGVFTLLQRSGEGIDSDADSAFKAMAFDNLNQDLRNGLLGQETGVRGYALTGNRSYLEPYTAGANAVAVAQRQLDSSVSQAARATLKDEQLAVSSWQKWAVDRIAAVDQYGPGAAASDAEGKRLFDSFRERWVDLDRATQQSITGERRSLSARLATQRSIRLAGWVLVLASVLALALLIFRGILRPILAQARILPRIDGGTLLDIPGAGRGDEIGRLASALATLQLTLRERLTLARAMADVGAEADLNKVLGLSVETMAGMVDAEDATVTLIAGEGREIVHSKSGLFPPGMLVAASSPGTAAIANLAPVVTMAADLPESPVKDAVIKHGYGPILILPLVSGGEPIGTLNSLRKVGRPQFSQTEISQAEFMAPFVATAIKAAKLIRELREASTVKSRFLANMSHELRTPLNAILGFSQVLSAGDFGPLTDRQSRYVSHIEASGRRLIDLINDILDLAKVEAGLMQVSPLPIEVGPVVLESRSQIERQAGAKGITLEYRMMPGLWATADPRRLQQVVLNLLSNAVKFTPDGGRVIVESRRADRQQVAITVTDTGIGIAPEDQERVFDEFAQADNNDSREHKGTGLGLSLSRKLTEMMGGSLTLASEVGQGSRFTVVVPAAEAATTVADGPVILVVEDEQPNLEFVTVILEGAGYRTSAARNLAAARRKLTSNPPDAVILDIALPDGDGWAVVDEMVQRDMSARVPVLVVTAADEPPEKYREVLAAFMTKPVKQERLLAELARALDAARSNTRHD
jgi:signal transduction histidine kinase/CheY-like chemotaxis protein